MKLLKLILLVCAATLFALSCGNTTDNNNQTATVKTQPSPAATATPATPTPTPDELAEARNTYNAACIRCHMENGEGGTVELDEGGTLKIPSFKSAHSIKHTDQQFARQIAKGGDGMPAFEKRLTPEQINNLVKYIRREFHSNPPQGAASPASVGGH